MSRTRKALEGVKVADFSWVAAGPIMTRYLADYGATVVKIESLARPDISRISYPYKDRIPGINRSGQFANYNRNKYSLCLKLTHPRGIEVARKMAAWADIVADNFTPGTMDEWGLGYEDLKKIKPDIIMISNSMLGQTGPQSRHLGLGFQLVSLAGVTHLTGWPDRLPGHPYAGYTDLIVPPLGIALIMAALAHRHRTGKGQRLDLSQFEAATYFLSAVNLDYEVNGREMIRMGNRSPQAAPHGAYRCQGQDRWCAISVSTDAEWQSFCQVLGNPAWCQDTKFSTFLGRKQNEDELDSLVTTWTIQHSAEEVMTLMQQAGVPAGAVWNSQDVHQDPQLEARQYFWRFEHTELGSHLCDGSPIKLSKTPAQPQRPAPLLGEHNEFVCKELLGMSEKEYIDLLLAGVFE